MKAPYLPLFILNWLSSRHVLAMPGNCVKVYVYLLCESWGQTPRATLPNDDSELLSMARCSAEEWLLIKPVVMERFLMGNCQEHQGRLYDPFLLEQSRKFESNQRFRNGNAKRTRNTRAKSPK
jgi:uncharacterized protein YdaU (DUF1376 family)